MVPATVTDVRVLVLDSTDFGLTQVSTLREILANDASATRRLRETAAVLQGQIREASGAAGERLRLRLGIVEYLLGRTTTAVERLRAAGDDPIALYFLGRTLSARGDHTGAAAAYQKAGRHGFDPILSGLYRVGALRSAGKREEAATELRNLEPQAVTQAEYHCQAGCLLADNGDSDGALRHFTQALDLDPHHVETLFHAAYLYDLYGNEDHARELYERCVSRSPVHLGALLNLGVLYEDSGLYDRAARCFQRVLNIYPTHGRGRLFMKDVQASLEMYYDEEEERRYDKLSQLLKMPVSDFELSVRSRNCLKKMNIHFLGDLVNTTEEELLGSKNFGETSLQEIKDLLQTKGLRLGMGRDLGAPRAQEPEREELSPTEQAALTQPVGSLNLSMRARKCLSRLNISSLAELVAYSGDQLLEVKNFGVMSLNEIRAKLGDIGLKLRGD